MIYSLGERRVQLLGERHYIADNATVIGSVILHDQTSVWFNAVLRGDNDPIEIGPGSNVQDAAVLHADPGFPLLVGTRVTIGHKVMLHGCQIGDRSLIGIGSIVLNGARIGNDCLVGANSLVTEGKSFPDGSLIIGAPARVARALSAEEITALRQPSQNYIDKIDSYSTGLQRQQN